MSPSKKRGFGLEKAPRKKKSVEKQHYEQIRKIIRELDKGNTVPAKNYLSNLLPQEDLRVYGSAKIAEQFREEGLAKQTEAEKKFAKILRELSIRYEPQKDIFYTPGKWYRVDFYIPMKRLVVEVDGGYHKDPEQIEKDKIREDTLKSKKLTVVRYTNEEVLQDPNIKEAVLKMYKNVCVL